MAEAPISDLLVRRRAYLCANNPGASLLARMNMVGIGFLFLSLTLAVSAAGAVAHFYYGVTRADAGLLTLLGVAIAAIYAITLPWRRRGALVQKDSESQAPST